MYSLNPACIDKSSAQFLLLLLHVFLHIFIFTFFSFCLQIAARKKKLILAIVGIIILAIIIGIIAYEASH